MSQQSGRPYVLQVMTGAWSAQAVYVAAKLGVADMLAQGPRDVQDLADEAGVDAAPLYRVLRALASLGIFRIREDEKFELTCHAEPLTTDHPFSLRQFAIMVNEEYYEAFGGLLDTVKSSYPSFDRRFGISYWAYLDSHPEVAATFHQAMNDWSNWDTAEIIESYNFDSFRKIVDVGGGNGAFLSELMARYPGLVGILFDRQPAIEAARAGCGGPLPRCDFISGDFLVDDIPGGGDLYIIKHVIDGYPDEEAIMILRNVSRAMAWNGRVLVLDCVVEPGNDPSFIKLLDLMVMTTTRAGRMRQVSDYPNIFSEAGLRLGKVTRISDSVSLLEGIPRE